MYLGAAVVVNINDLKVYYMITTNEINNLFEELTPENSGLSDFTNNDKVDLLMDTGSISRSPLLITRLYKTSYLKEISILGLSIVQIFKNNKANSTCLVGAKHL